MPAWPARHRDTRPEGVSALSSQLGRNGGRGGRGNAHGSPRPAHRPLTFAPMTQPPPAAPPPPPFRATLVRVMAVQVVTLVLLWVLQSRFTL